MVIAKKKKKIKENQTRKLSFSWLIFKYLKMSPHRLEYLLKIVAPIIGNKDTKFQKTL